jgi:hypothetical protein
MSSAAHSASQQQLRAELPPHPVAPEAEPYLVSLSPGARELHELAVKMLGSSYFVERTHGYQKWLAKQSKS